MSFKKNGTDPVFNPAPFIGLNWVGAMAIALGFAPDPNAQRKEQVRYLHGGRRCRPTPRKRRSNMLVVSKRVRRKHRRAAMA